VEREALPVEPGGGERKHNRGGPLSGTTRTFCSCASRTKLCARIGNRRQACFGKQSCIAAGEERLEESRNILCLGVVIEPLDADALQWSRRCDAFQESARSFGSSAMMYRANGRDRARRPE